MTHTFFSMTEIGQIKQFLILFSREVFKNKNLPKFIGFVCRCEFEGGRCFMISSFNGFSIKKKLVLFKLFLNLSLHIHISA